MPDRLDIVFSLQMMMTGQNQTLVAVALVAKVSDPKWESAAAAAAAAVAVAVAAVAAAAAAATTTTTTLDGLGGGLHEG